MFRPLPHLLLAAALLAGPAAHAQRTDSRPPTQNPFGRPLAPEVPGGRYKSHSYKDGVLTVYATDGSTRQVQPWAEGVVKISYFAPGRPPVPDSSVAVVQSMDPYAAAEVSKPLPGRPPLKLASPVEATNEELRIYQHGPTVVVDKQTLRVSLVNTQATLFAEASPAFRRQPGAAGPTEGGDALAGRSDELAGTGVRVALQPGERLYGTGARALPLDRRGYRLELYNQAHYGYQNGEPALNVTLPVVLSSRGYLLLFDHHAAAYLDMGKKRPDALEYGAQGLNSLSYFVVTGGSQAEILNRYTALTGRQPLPPRWALGLIQSRFGYRSQAEMLEVARRMRAADFPLDALVLDLYWFGGTTRQGDLAWDAKNFPDPAGMMRELNGQGVKTILISEPYVMRTSANDSLVRTQGLVGTTAAGRPFTVGSFWAGPASILDVFKPQARTWLWAQYRRLHEQGAGGWWSDLGEPENHPLTMHHAPGTTAQVHNAYGITWAKILQDGYAREFPDERLFNLARSGWAGMQRNAVFPWSGDINRSWSGLQAQVPIMLGMGQAGVGYMHSDAGGFGANADRDPELYTRWLQMAALCPIMRPHSDQVVPPEPYTYPEPYQSIVRHYAHLRAELLPYLYTLAAENTLTGAPLVRALDYTPGEPGDDNSSWTAPLITPSSLLSAARLPAPGLFNSQYLLGPNLLVAPVSEPGQRRRNVWLPATPGSWVDVETGETLPSGQLVGLPAPLSHMPLLARAGGIVPATRYRPSAAAFRPDTLEVRYYPDPAVLASGFTVYEDDGHSAQALARREFTKVSLVGNYLGPGKLTFTVGVQQRYPGMPMQRTVRLHVARVAAAPAAITLDQQPLAATAWHYDPARHELTAVFSLSPQSGPIYLGATLGLTGLRLLTRPAATLAPDAQTLQLPESRRFGQQAGLRYETYLPASAPLRIRDARGQLVRELATSSAVGPHTLAWDGRDQQGRPVPLGYYDVELAGQHQRLVRVPTE